MDNKNNFNWNKEFLMQKAAMLIPIDKIKS